MSRLYINTPDKAQKVVEGLYHDMERRIIASPPGICPVDLSLAFLTLCHAQTCGKCVPCRIGLGQLKALMTQVLDGEASMATIDTIEKTARIIKETADCAIGTEAANMVLKGVLGFRDDYEEHVRNNRCTSNSSQSVPCIAYCPAGVDVPGYISLVGEKRYADAVRLIRKDNPFPSACALICEHPCEARCRRTMIDAPLNIRGMKKYAVDHAGVVPPPVCAESTNKKVAVIGGGPGGLSAAYYLALMGHKVTVFEKEEFLGGMLRYGIPNYRLPRQKLQEDIDAIIATGGVDVKFGMEVGKNIEIEDIGKDYDAVYISIGAHNDRKLGIDGENANGVISAVDMLHEIGNNNYPNFEGKKVAVIGGGNVAMDVARSAIRANADEVSIVYRRRKDDMTALFEEIEGAVAEGAELCTLQAPTKVVVDENNNVVALTVQPQIVGEYDKSGRPRPVKANSETMDIQVDIVVVAIGQAIDSEHFSKYGLPVKRGVIEALDNGEVGDVPGIFAGGDCVTGPATVIKAIGAGKVAAANIDEYLGFNHLISCDVEIPEVKIKDRVPCARVNMEERKASERGSDFEPIELGLSEDEAMQEASRCLRCDHFGYASFKGGKNILW